MAGVVEVFVWVSLIVLVYTWLGYPGLLLTLWSLRRGRRKSGEHPAQVVDMVTVLVTVRDEEKEIEQRLRNIIATSFRTSSLEVLVASDGSRDGTNAIVDRMGKLDPRIRLLSLRGEGKSRTQNTATAEARGDIVVLTDAEARFQEDTISKLVYPFGDPDVGCSSGKVVLGSKSSGIAEGQGLYWRYEMWMRAMESAVGVLHTASGQVMAFRKSHFRPIQPQYGDDCAIPLDMLIEGLRVVHVDDAIAHDNFPSTAKGELKARARMTLRNITCTLDRLRLLNPFRHPLLTISILSHKLLRWLTPFFLLSLLLSNGFLLARGWYYYPLMCGQVLFYGFGVVGYVAERRNRRIPVASQVFSFILANVGFFLGVIWALSGKNITSYQSRVGSLP